MQWDGIYPGYGGFNLNRKGKQLKVIGSPFDPKHL